ncbi:MAG TPA: alpha-amylase family glycosyl hydrolase [Acidobacteriaceae bacterium]|nr:alpha-amylase family glycosyl hydrolase [Acidobacteriaceae bacterium]
MEFHIRGALREQLNLDDLLFSYTGNVIFADVAGSRKLAKGLNEARGAENDPSRTIHAGALFAMGLIDELNHALVARYRAEIDPGVLAEAVRWFAAQTEPAKLERLLLSFTEQFPNMAVYRGELTAAEWLKGSTDGLPNREAALEELLMLWLANINPAFAPFRELFEDTDLKQKTIYRNVTETFSGYFSTRPPLAPEVGTLLDALRAPMLASPESLTGQLEYIRTRWSKHLGAELRRVLLAIDILREEDLAIWLRFHPPGPDWHRHGAPSWGEAGFVGDEFIGFEQEFGPGGRRRYASDYQAPLHEYEAFSSDQAWMPNVVMLAKSTFVWLEQLSKKYQRHIYRLDQIPDEELRLLTDRGITALWLIGLWERSTASRTIKRLRGQHDAVASAYSLKGYDIAQDLGGREAFDSLKHRAAAFGLRMASDMVPNHMGIDSDWVIEHPDWFLYRWEDPFPSYSFNGPDLSNDSRVEIKIEDHYYDQSDAAVVFRLRHHQDGATRYVYHGNDGTSFAWNDTAQLDYSQAHVREHVIQTILHVARLSPIIRFDAAMVLAKRHVQRLWFPLPGTGGSIPSRAENAMSQEQFDALMPHEFWREVVDRVAAEVPGTLLLAEAFWLLEGYFVRTLGMHRVYNSAFMNMLRDEENAKYRSYLKKTIEFDPDILKRYVNFMSNPDERTAIDQFGTGDKYFGVSTMLATLPGLPMFGHGQIEGFTERYGMEFKQARMDESPNEDLIARHQREIAPLLKRRWLFAESTHFVLYDFWTGHGTVDENVFAYSNRQGDQRAVILYNNSYGTTHGTIHVSAAAMDKASGMLRQTRLDDGLGFSGYDAVVSYRDAASGLEYLRRAIDFHHHGLTVALRGYQHAVLLDWRELRPSADYPWDRLCDALRGEGVHSVDVALSMLRLRPLHDALRQAVSLESVRTFAAIAGELAARTDSESEVGASAKVAEAESLKKAQAKTAAPDGGSQALRVQALQLQEFLEKCRLFSEFAASSLPTENRELAARVSAASPKEDAVRYYRENCERQTVAAARFSLLEKNFAEDWPVVARLLPHSDEGWALIVAWIVVGSLPWKGNRVAAFDGLQLRAAFAEIFSSFGMDGERKWRAAAELRVLLLKDDAPDFHSFWNDGDVRWLAGVNESDGVTYVNKELFEELIDWLELPALLEIAEQDANALEAILEMEAFVEQAREAVAEAGYRLDAYRKSNPGSWSAEENAEQLPDSSA